MTAPETRGAAPGMIVGLGLLGLATLGIGLALMMVEDESTADAPAESVDETSNAPDPGNLVALADADAASVEEALEDDPRPDDVPDPEETGPGGGGQGVSVIDIGNLGVIGRPADAPADGVIPDGTGPTARVRTGALVVRGSLSAAVVRRVVRRHAEESRFCYAQALLGAPDLEGRITVAFTISPTGAVSEASVGQSTVRNSGLEACLASVVRRWRFPSPDGGGIVRVDLPYVLSTTN